MKCLLVFILLILSVQCQSYSSFLQENEEKEKEKDKEIEFQIKFKDLFDYSTLVRDTEKSYFNLSLKAEDLVDQMGMGYDLSNTLDAHIAQDKQYNQGLSSETCWGNPYTTEEMIDSFVSRGFKSLIIPVAWHNHIIDNDYTIDPKWMKRVKTVVDWAYSKGLYVILNTHHDDAKYSEGNITHQTGYYLSKKKIELNLKDLFIIFGDKLLLHLIMDMEKDLFLKV